MIGWFNSILKLSVILFFSALLIPVFGGLLGVALPAFGYMPALGETQFSWNAFSDLFATSGVGKMVWLSLSSAFGATVIAFILAMVLLARFYQTPWLNKVQHMLSPMLVVPHGAAAMAFAFMVVPSGWIARMMSPWLTGWDLPINVGIVNDHYGVAMTLALALKELPFLFLMALSVLSQPQLQQQFSRQFQVAQTLGYGPTSAFFKVVFPRLYGLIRLPLLAVLAYASANVEMPLLLGPNNPPTLAVAVIQWFNDVDLTLRFKASAAALLHVFVSLGLLGFWIGLEKALIAAYQHRLYNGVRYLSERFIRLGGNATAVFLLLFVTINSVMLLLWSVAGFWPYPEFFPNSLTLMHWQNAAPQLATPLFNTLVLGAGVSITAVLLSLLVLEYQAQQGRQRFIIPVLYVPLLVPGVALLFGLLWLSQWSQAVDSPWFIVFIGHFIYVLPYVYIALAVSYERLDKRYSQVGQSLGQTPWQVFYKVKLGQLFGPILVAIALGLAISFSQYLPTLLGSAGRIATLTTDAVATYSGGSRRLMAVYVVLQALLPLIGFILAWWLPKVLLNPAVVQANHVRKEK
jgi:putative thiamine transport system permease protein